MIEWSKFSRSAFESGEFEELCSELANALSSGRASGETGMALIDKLRAVGHDLWSFDEDGEGYEAWCGDWTKKQRASGELVITFANRDWCEVSWKAGDDVVVASFGERVDDDCSPAPSGPQHK